MMRQGSNLSSNAGLVILAVLTGVAAVLEARTLLTVLVLLFLLCLLARLWARGALAKVTVRPDRAEAAAFPGEQLHLTGSVTNGKLLPLIYLTLSLSVRRDGPVAAPGEGGEEGVPSVGSEPGTGEAGPDGHAETLPGPDAPASAAPADRHDASAAAAPAPDGAAAPAAAAAGPGTDPRIRSRAAAQPPLSIPVRFRFLMPWQSVDFDWTFDAVRRGIVTASELCAESGDGFSLAVCTRMLPLARPLTLCVYPRLVGADAGPLLRTLRTLGESEQGIYADPTLTRFTRPYQAGDSIRDINWRQLARTGRVQTNVRAHLTPNRAAFALLLSSYTAERVWEYGGERHTERCVTPALEETLSLLASLIVALTRERVLVTLFLPAYGDTPERVCAAETPDVQIPLLLRALAEIDYAAQSCSFAAPDPAAGEVYLLCDHFDPALERRAGLAADACAVRILREVPGAPVPGIYFTETELRRQ